MSTNPSVSATSPGPGCPGLQPRSTPVRGNPNTCAPAGPAGGVAGSETTRPSPSPAACARPRQLTERREWNEWVPASSDARGNQMITREGPRPPPHSRRPLGSRKQNAGTCGDSAAPPSSILGLGLLETEGPACCSAIRFPGRLQLSAHRPER